MALNSSTNWVELWAGKNLGFEIFVPGFDRIKVLYDRYKKYFKAQGTQIITIGGTNGKGETALRLEHKLIENGYQVSTWTSPHIHSVAERFRFNGKQLDLKSLGALFIKCDSLIKLEKIKLSYYEFLFFVYLEFSSQKEPLDYLILEVGLGGRLDAVNFFDADYTATTSISLDHTSLLGNKLKMILFEKLGIMRSNSPHLSALEQKELVLIERKLCKDRDVEMIDLFDTGLLKPEDHYRYRNHLLATGILSLVKFGKIDHEFIVKQKFDQIDMPGRYERQLFNKAIFTYVGAHNPDGVEKFVEYALGDQLKIDSLCLSFSQREEKEIEKMIESSLTLCSTIFLFYFDHYKAVSKNKLFHISEKYSLPLYDLEMISQMKIEGESYILGSYYFIGEAHHHLQ